jgi:hypothetical protein
MIQLVMTQASDFSSHSPTYNEVYVNWVSSSSCMFSQAMFLASNGDCLTSS